MPGKFFPKFFALLITLAAALPAVIRAQDCSPPKIVANSRIYNIFTPEQEMVLGDLTFQRMSGDLRFVRDQELNAYLDNIARKLVGHLPPTGLKFQFHIVDIPEANAFNIPGGYVFISRKLIGFVNNEDELAGVLAHELGHAVVRHGASDLSELLRKILNVTQVGDQKDIAEKYNLFLERHRTKSISRDSGHENEQQLEADRIGLFAMVAAGYDPDAFAAFFDRLVETKGKTGNWFSDIFGKAKPEQKRLREMIKATQQLPQPCRENHQSTASNQFLKWQADVVSFREVNKKEDLPGLLWKKELSPKLRSDITHLAFSNDGKYFLAQDDFAITIVQRDPLEVLFQIPAPEAKKSSFTPDGQFVVFGTEGLRYEKWSIAERKPVEVRELVLRRDCWEHEFSPDGKYLACVDYGTNLNVLDTQAGKKVWEKKDFYRLTFFELLTWITSGSRDDGDRPRFFNIEFSPDSRFLAVSRTHRFRFRFRIDVMTVDESDNTLVALDLGTLKPVSAGGELKKVTQRPFLFLDSGRILGMSNRKLSDGGIFSFPEGKRLAKFDLGAEELKGTGNPKYVVLKPLANAKMGILDLSRNTIVSGLNKADATMWNDLMVFEGTSGKVLISETRYNEEKKMLERRELGAIEIPVSSVAQLSAAEVSDNFQWLAISSKTRGALWSLNSGERKLFVRGFRGALLGNDGAAVGDFPRLDPVNHSLALMNPNDNSVNVLREMPDKGARQHGRFVLIRQSLNQKKDDKDKSADKQASSQADEESETSLAREVRMELRDIINDKVVWSREYPKEAPSLFFDEFSGRLIFYWTLGSDAGKARLKEDPGLEARSKAMGNKDDDYLIEVYDAFAGKTKGTLLVETGKGSFDIQSGFSEGNWLVLHDSHNRVLTFSITDGELRHRFFGANAAINPARSQIVVENNPGELTLYDLTTGDSQGKLVFRRAAAFVRFSLDGKKLFVLSDDQIAHAFDLEKLQARTTTAMQ